jgi:hypothetical protein
LLIAQGAAPEEASDNSPSFYCLSLIVAVVLCVVIFRWRRRLRLEQELRSIRQQLKTEYSKKYEDRKITIGIIKCSQCEWVGEWGTGMSYEQFFAGDLAEHGIYVGRSKGEKSSLSLNNRQYECPVCNSSDWQKARDIQGVNYWIKRADQVGGPKSRQEVVKLAKASKIKLNDEISNSKDGPWKSLTKEDLQQMLGGSDIEIE